MKSIFSNFNLRPINKTAGLVTSTDFEFKPIKEFENVYKDIPTIIDSGDLFYYIGACFGRFEVIGLHQRRSNKSNSWVCRCSCGNYALCSTKRINAALKDSSLFERSMCNECDYLIYIRSNRSPMKPLSKTNRSLKKLKREGK